MAGILAAAGQPGISFVAIALLKIVFNKPALWLLLTHHNTDATKDENPLLGRGGSRGHGVGLVSGVDGGEGPDAVGNIVGAVRKGDAAGSEDLSGGMKEGGRQ